MSKWSIKKIKNKNSNYDFRLISKNNDYSNINFFKYSYFRILVSLSSYLSNGVIFKNSYYKISTKKKVPAIFDFSLDKFKVVDTYLSIDDDLTKIIFVNKNKTFFINTLTKPDTGIYSSLFIYENIDNLKLFLKNNSDSYSHVKYNANQKYIITGWISLGKKNHVIMDLIKYNSKFRKNILTRCKIFDKKIIDKLNKVYSITKKEKTGYCLFIVNFKNGMIDIDTIIPVSFDEYLTYVYDLMLPYKYDFNDKINLFASQMKIKVKDYKNDDIERLAFAIDPQGSKDRDDAIAAFYLDRNGNKTNLEGATFIKLIVHISDTLSYISPGNQNYYYHYSKFKCNTDYLDKYTLPMMDKILSEDYLSLDGEKNKAITINLTYKILKKDMFLISPKPDKVEIHRSSNLKIYGTTYKEFSETFGLTKNENFDNSNFIKRSIINCNETIDRNINYFIYEGKSLYPNNTKNMISNNLKQLYIFFVNSLDHTRKDSMLKISSNFVRQKISGYDNLYLEFSPVEMWSHSLVEYTALESNIYFSYLLYLNNIGNFRKGNVFEFYKKDILSINEKIGKKNIELIINNSINNKNVKGSKVGIFRNLYTPEDGVNYYLNSNIRKIIKKIWFKYKSKSVNKKIYELIIDKFLSKFKYYKEETHEEFIKLILALRQILLIINSKSKLDVASKLISKEMKMKAKYDFFPMCHFDIGSFFYTHATSPMRRFIDINVHNLIFNEKSRQYIYNNIDLEGINKSFQVGKFINQLVNAKRFIEFIKLNNVNTKVKVIEDNMIGLVDFATFFNFNSNFGLDFNINFHVSIKPDEFDIPILKKISKDEKLFNIFFHMLKKENKVIQDKCKIYLQKIFNLKQIDKIC